MIYIACTLSIEDIMRDILIELSMMLVLFLLFFSLWVRYLLLMMLHLI